MLVPGNPARFWAGVLCALAVPPRTVKHTTSTTMQHQPTCHKLPHEHSKRVDVRRASRLLALHHPGGQVVQNNCAPAANHLADADLQQVQTEGDVTGEGANGRGSGRRIRGQGSGLWEGPVPHTSCTALTCPSPALDSVHIAASG